MDPRALKGVMDKLGIKSTDIAAKKVTIELEDKYIIIDNPQVILIEAQGIKSFQVSGNISEAVKQQQQAVLDITEEDIKFVMAKAGISDEAKARDALVKAQGDLALAISLLKDAQ
ncbi:MAG: nascent polypeptide-associated complex protein [Candidatus Micrarchaeia archaeon]